MANIKYISHTEGFKTLHYKLLGNVSKFFFFWFCSYSTFCLVVFLFSDRLINLAADFCKILVFWISNWIGYSNIEINNITFSFNLVKENKRIISPHVCCLLMLIPNRLITTKNVTSAITNERWFSLSYAYKNA